MKRLVHIALNVFAALFGGLIIANIVARLPITRPAIFNDALLSLLHATGHNELANPYDMEILAMLTIVIASIVAAGIIAWIINRAMTNKRARRAANPCIRQRRPRMQREAMPKRQANDK